VCATVICASLLARSSSVSAREMARREWLLLDSSLTSRPVVWPARVAITRLAPMALKITSETIVSSSVKPARVFIGGSGACKGA